MKGFLLFLSLCGCCGYLVSGEVSPTDRTFFESKVRPLLLEHCHECHSAEHKIKGGLRLDSKEAWAAGGDSGEVIRPGNPGGSLLVESVHYKNADLQMPPKYKLDPEDIATLEQWIALGAPDPRAEGEEPVGNGLLTEEDLAKGREHWSFRPIRRPLLPIVHDEEWVRDDLDRFLLAKIEDAGISPSPDADRFTLIRRISFDLTGLPPSVAEINAFVKDPEPDDVAIAKVVDHMLASQRFGERWGRHWLDLARYADSMGRSRNLPFPYAWRYRNYIIDSFNRDKPYDQFLSEQIAGDLMEAENEEQLKELLVATGFLALGSMNLNEGNRELAQLDRIDEQIDTLGRSVLALSVSCARCHDHKFDPVAQHDYYALGGVFASTETLTGLRNARNGENYTNSSALISLNSARHLRNSEQDRELFATRKLVDELRIAATDFTLTDREIRRASSDLEEARKDLSRMEERAARNNKPRTSRKLDPKADYAMGVREGDTTDLAIRLRGEPDMHGEFVSRGFLRVLLAEESESNAVPDDRSGRLELAQWLISPEHPLTSRVMVNRIWNHLTGRGIVSTVDDFGVAGATPSHPELLDFLASESQANDWSIKSLIRRIILSRTYRMDSSDIPANSEVDEANELFWRMNLRRVEAEVIRDSLLSAGGILELRRPSRAPVEKLSDSSIGRDGISNLPESFYHERVRSVYLPVFRSHLPEAFSVFDFADPTLVNGQRDVTTVPPQALYLLNNDFVIDVSRRGADRILRTPLPDKASRIRHAYAYALCRRPTEAELERADSFIQNRDDWALFLQALFSTAEFRYVR
ncbi:MAG: PSD1 and planctomycete cytochrome C domain-containing protein [Verrucomicrobiota bacterium]